MEKLKVLIVDDSSIYRRILAAAVEATGIATPEQTASNGNLAIERLSSGTYDAVLMDVNMPEMDGIEALGIIKSKWPKTAVIMISGTGGKNAEITLRALEMGAMDFIVKPIESDYEKNMSIVSFHLKMLFAQIKIAMTAKAIQKTQQQASHPPILPPTQNPVKHKLTGVDLVLIASSTGGPVALEKVFRGFSKNFSKPVLVVQHMPPDFTKVLANSLDKNSQVRCIEGAAGDTVRAGQAIIAPGGYHMEVSKNELHAAKQIRLNTDGYVNGVRPAADVLFESVAKQYQGARILTVVLTGMGSDGTKGVRTIKENCACYCISQSESTCVVYGMPRSVFEAGLSDEVVDLEKIASRIEQVCENGS